MAHGWRDGSGEAMGLVVDCFVCRETRQTFCPGSEVVESDLRPVLGRTGTGATSRTVRGLRLLRQAGERQGRRVGRATACGAPASR